MKKFVCRFLSLILVFGLLISSFAVLTFADNGENELKIISMPDKIEYYAGEALDTSGLVLEYTTAEGSVQAVTSGFTCSPGSFSEAGQYDVTVKYKGEEVTFKVNVVAAELAKITVNTLPEKTVYHLSERYEPEGLSVNLFYANGKTVIANEGFICEPYKFNSVGKAQVTVYYGGKTCTFEVDVIQRDLSAIYLVNGAVYKCYTSLQTGDSVPVPQNPEVSGMTFTGWTPAVPDTVHSNSMTFTALFDDGEPDIYCADIADAVYTGSPVQPEIKVYSSADDSLLKLGADYTVTFKNNLNTGTAFASVVGLGEYKSEIVELFEVLPVNEGIEVSPIPAQTYCGTPLCPVPHITCGGAVLTQGVDYTVEYLNNNAPGKATAVITFKGNYSSTASVDFEIKEGYSDFFAFAGKNTVEYSAPLAAAELTVTNGGKVLEEGTDYTVEFSSSQGLGITSLRVNGKGDYNGKTVDLCITVVPCDLSAGECFVTEPACFYTGEPIQPGFDLEIYGAAVPSTGFNVVYENNVNAGTMTLVITGKGNYCGELRKNHVINNADITSQAVSHSGVEARYTMGEGAIEPVPELAFNGKKLEHGRDYVIAYKDNSACGIAAVTVIGVGNFSGERIINFEIVPPVQTSVKITDSVDTLDYKDEFTAQAEVTLADGVSADTVWSVSDEEIATVDENGKVTSVGEGTVTVTVTLIGEDGKPITDEEGNVYSASFEIECEMTFWDKIVRFFERIFDFFKF